MLILLDGKNGNGKSLFSMFLMVPRLVHGNKTVATNQEELRLDELNAFCQEIAKRADVPPPDLHTKLIQIDKDQSPQYYRFRAHGLLLPAFPEINDDGKRIRYDEFLTLAKDYFKPVKEQQARDLPPGVCYFLDEAQDYFNSREWASSGRMVSWHITKHRHLDDDIIWMTPACEELDAGIKRKVHEWYRLVNMRRMKWKGFRMPGQFEARLYYSEPKPGAEPVEVRKFTLGQGYENLYYTRGALGAKAGAETEHKIRALPFPALIAGLAVAGILLMAGIIALPRLIGSGMHAMLAGIHRGIDTSLPQGSPAPKGHPIPARASKALTSEKSAPHGPSYDGIMGTTSETKVHLRGGRWTPAVGISTNGLAILADGTVVPPAAELSK